MTPIAIFRTSCRFVLGDNGSDATLFSYPDDSIDGAVQTVIRMGKLRGYCLLQSDPTQITPDVTDPNKFALVTYHVASLFIDPMLESYSFKTRSQSERFGSAKKFVSKLESEIYHLENGAMFSGWMNYFNWLTGMSGLPLGQVLTQLNVRQPIFGQQFTIDSFPLPIDEVIHF